MLDDDEFEAEISMFRTPTAPPLKKTQKKRFSDYANEGVEDDDDQPPPPPRRQLSQLTKKKASFLIEEDEDDDDLPKSRQLNIKPVAGAAVVPYRLQEAASLLLGDRRISQSTASELTVAYLQKSHEFVMVDPLIIVCASVDTGTSRIYCKELVNVSLHWMALALDASFFLQVTPKVRTQDEPWAEAVTARPCRSAQVSERIQPVGTLAAVKRAIDEMEVPEDLDKQIEQYMKKLGKVDSASACDPEWAREHIDAFRAIFSGTNKKDEMEGKGIRDKLAKIN